jgi:coenzyme F420-reducing hydrogenase delta subunit
MLTCKAKMGGYPVGDNTAAEHQQVSVLLRCFVSDMVPCPVENTFYLCTMSVTQDAMMVTGCHVSDDDDGDRVPCQ